MIEFHELIDIVPHDLVRRMENVSAVLVDVNAFLSSQYTLPPT